MPRELVANWLLTVVGNFFTRCERFQFTTDPRGGDGIIYDTHAPLRGGLDRTRHRSCRLSPGDGKDVQSQILEAVTNEKCEGWARLTRVAKP